MHGASLAEGCLFTATLQLLDLEGNAIADWAEVLKLAALPSLRHLWLGGNRLQQIAGSAAQGIINCVQSSLLAVTAVNSGAHQHALPPEHDMLMPVEEVAWTGRAQLLPASALVACWPLSCQRTNSLALTQIGVSHLQGLLLGCRPCC